MTAFQVSAEDVKACFEEVGVISDDTLRLSSITDDFRDENGENLVTILICLAPGMPFASYPITHYLSNLSEDDARMKLLELNSRLVCAQAIMAYQESKPIYLVSSSLRPELYINKISKDTIREAVVDTINTSEVVATFLGA